MELRMFPAHAGMIPAGELSLSKLTNVPRTRGDDPPPFSILAEIRRCSPHTRG